MAQFSLAHAVARRQWQWPLPQQKSAAALMSTGMRGASPRCGVVRMSTWDELRCAPRQKLAEFAGTEIFSIDFP